MRLYETDQPTNLGENITCLAKTSVEWADTACPAGQDCRDVNEARMLRERARERRQRCEDENENETKIIFPGRERDQHYENENENETSETE